MNKRWIFIGTGTFLLVVGIAGFALLQTGVFETLVGPGTQSRLEIPQSGTSPEVPGQAGQSRLEGKIPAPSPKGTPPAPQAGTQTARPPDNLAAEQPMPGGGSAIRPDVQGERTEIPSQIPPVLKGERRYPGQGDISQQPPTRSRPGTGGAAAGAGVGRQAYQGYAAPQNIPGTRQPDTGGSAAGAGVGRRAYQAYATPESIPETRQPVTIRFLLDSERNRDIKVARVHLGDRVVINVRRFGPAERQIYLGFDLPGRTSERSSRYYGRVVRKSGVVITPVKDSDQLTIEGGELFGAALSRKLDSKDGAVLKVGAKQPGRRDYRQGQYQGENGRCEIEVKIYSGNRWNIRPRSLL